MVFLFFKKKQGGGNKLKGGGNNNNQGLVRLWYIASGTVHMEVVMAGWVLALVLHTHACAPHEREKKIKGRISKAEDIGANRGV